MSKKTVRENFFTRNVLMSDSKEEEEEGSLEDFIVEDDDSSDLMGESEEEEYSRADATIQQVMQVIRRDEEQAMKLQEQEKRRQAEAQARRREQEALKRALEQSRVEEKHRRQQEKDRQRQARLEAVRAQLVDDLDNSLEASRGVIDLTEEVEGAPPQRKRRAGAISKGTADANIALKVIEKEDATPSTASPAVSIPMDPVHVLVRRRDAARVSLARTFCCPITTERFIDPVSTPQGHVYERAAILLWLKQSQTCPSTRMPLKEEDLRPARFVTRILQQASELRQIEAGLQHCT